VEVFDLMRRDLFHDDHESYRKSVRDFLEKEVVPHYPDRIVPRALFAQAAELGAFAAVPEEYGGAGVRDFRYSVVLAEEAVRAGVLPATLGIALQADVCLPYLLALGSAEQKARWLPGIATGETVTAFAMTEPGAGSDLAALRTRAVRVGDGYVVDGAKTSIPNGITADLVIVAVRTDVDPHRGLSLLVVERGTRGFERCRPLDTGGSPAQDTADLVFTGARVPAANLLGAEGEGYRALTRNLPQERLSLAVSAVAQAAAAIDWTVTHVRQRTAFGAPLGDLQHVRFRLAELVTEVDIAQQYVDRCVQEFDAGRLTPVDAAKARWWCTELQRRVIEACVQLHGAYGGATEVMKEIIGRSLELDRVS
jgi:alkylation response protein AidB-like acyl-CoA dehydrogenase